MEKFELLITWLAAHASALYRFIGSVTVGIMLGIPTLFLFGDTLLSLIGHALAAGCIEYQRFQKPRCSARLQQVIPEPAAIGERVFVAGVT